MSNGIYCLEGLWDSNISRKDTVSPILELIEKRSNCPYIYRDCATKNELELYLKKWATKSISSKYPILYLAFHGNTGGFQLEDKHFYTLEELGELLAEKCYAKIIHFGSCSTLDIDKRKIQKFLAKTWAIAAIGYKSEIDWYKSTVMDLFIFEALLKDQLDNKGIKKIKKDIFTNYGKLHKLLDLRIEINETHDFPRHNHLKK